MGAPELRDGWFPDPFERYDERFFVYGEPSRLVRRGGVEATDPQGAVPGPAENVTPPPPPQDEPVEAVESAAPVVTVERVVAVEPIEPVAPVAPVEPVEPVAPVVASEPTDRRFGAAPRRLPGWGWAVFAALCATIALVFVGGSLLAVALVFGLLAVVGLVCFGMAVRADHRTRRAPTPRLPTVDLHERPDDPFADGLSVSNDLDRLVEVAGVERVS